jgi:hypothetical protein
VSWEGDLDASFPNQLPALILARCAVAAPSAAKTAAAIFLRTRFIDGQVPAVQFLPVQGADGALRFGVATHLDETESLGPACIPVRNDADALNGSILFEQRTDRVFGSPKAEVSYKYIFQSELPFDY